MLYEVVDVPQNNPCNNCNPCMRMRLLELGFVSGQDIEITEMLNGMYIVEMISDGGYHEQTIALRKDELGRVCYKIK